MLTIMTMVEIKLCAGQVRMTGVKWDARTHYQYEVNYKILQATFRKVGIDKARPYIHLSSR